MQDQIFLKRIGRGRAFTLVELIVVIAIIVVLIGILIPVASKVRQAARIANTKSWMTQLSRSIDDYYNDFHDYPGPLTNLEVWNDKDAWPNKNVYISAPGWEIANAQQEGFAIAQPTGLPVFNQAITMSENLVLGLLGGLRVKSNINKMLTYDPRMVGSGAVSLNPNLPSKQYKPYLEAKNLSWRTQTNTATGQPEKTGHFVDDADPTGAYDSIIPEFVDTFIDPMPILYLRAKRGAFAQAAASANAVGPTNNTICTFDPVDSNNRVGQYDLHQIIAYTKSKIGTGRDQITQVGWLAPVTHGLYAAAGDQINVTSTLKNPSPNALVKYKFPYDAYPYFRNTALSTPADTEGDFLDFTKARNDVPYQKDAYILIGAGPDRIYGTKDDITNFGEIGGN